MNSITLSFSHYLNVFYTQISAALPRVATGLFIFIASWAIGIVFHTLISRLVNHSKSRRQLIQLLAKIVKISTLIIGFVTGLGTMGINITALVTSLGLAGFALSFALKDILSNTLAGILILFYEPFKNGDNISLSSTTGKVLDTNLRYTTLDSDNKKVIIPNSTLLSNVVTVEKVMN